MSTNGRIIQTRLFTIILVLGCGLTGRAYEFAGGTGEPNDPYQIATVEDLLAVGSSKDLLTKHYVLVNDLDLDPNLPGGRVFDDALIARLALDSVTGEWLTPFSGVLDGRGHTIRNLYISHEAGIAVGLIGELSGLVKDLNLEGVRIGGSALAMGAMAGHVSGGTIRRCSVTGQVSGDTGVGGLVGHLSNGTLADCRAEVQISGVRLVGGLFGSSHSGTVVRCEAQGEVRGDQRVGGLGGDLFQGCIMESSAGGVVVGTDYVGGLIGYASAMGCAILRCAATCEVVAEQAAGGLIGNASLVSRGPIMDCYTRGSVTGSPAGGLVGAVVGAQVLNSYAACEVIPLTPGDGTAAVAGGLFGEAGASSRILVDGCFWDTGVSGVGLSTGQGVQYIGTGLTTVQMQQKATFEQAGWDLDSVWAIAEGEYPVLQWE
ncbi:MAG: GLUG motif-containing protein, partial [Phycisphaerales bacterium]